jgi:hypothetical protein
MDTTLNPKQTDPRHVLLARADEELAHAYEQITRADEQIARAEEQLSKLEHKAARHPGKRPLFDRPAVRGLTGVLLAACVGVAAIALQSPYGDAAKLIIARWTPQLILTSSLPIEKRGLPAQPSPSAVQVAAAEPVAAQPTPLAQTAPQDVAPTAAPVSPEVAQLLQTMARDLANVEQRIEQLKASQEQMATDNAKAVEQLKASQEQMTRLIAKASEQNLRPKASAPPPRPIASPTRKPVPKLPSPQARAPPRAPMPLQPEEQ